MIPSIADLHEWLYAQCDLARDESVADLGCGRGTDLLGLARHATGKASLIGFDKSATALREASTALSAATDACVALSDLAHGIPVADRTFDLVYSCNFLECVVDKSALMSEVRRVLRPAGRVMFSHWDFDSQFYDSSDADKPLIRSILAAYSDWKQEWMPAADGWMGRRLWKTFQAAGGFTGEVRTRTIVETEFGPDTFGQQMALSFASMVPAGLIGEDQYRRFLEVQQELHASGNYFYSITMYAYIGRLRS